MPVTVSQGRSNEAVTTLGAGTQMFPALGNPAVQSLASAPAFWGWFRGGWTERRGITSISGFPVIPVQRNHVAASLGSSSVCALHFAFDGAAFEILFAGRRPEIVVVADGRYASPQLITTTLAGGVAGAVLDGDNTFTRIDFGSAATRRISLYAVSSFGPCAIAVPAGTTVTPWDRGTEASMAVMADSYGGAHGPRRGIGGPYFEAAALLGIPHMDIDALGGTGFSVNLANADTANAGNVFEARLAGIVDARPDLFLAAGGINDNNFYPMPPVYASAAQARAGFEAAVLSYFAALRRHLPDAVLAATGPWAPRQVTPTNSDARAKADAILAGLRAAGGPWVFMDNLDGGWTSSSGARGGVAGAWQTGTGTVASPAGNGNGDLYLDPDGTHPNPAGCAYLGSRIADDLRAALPTL